MSHKDKVMKLVSQRGEINTDYVLLYDGQPVVSFDYADGSMLFLNEDRGLRCEYLSAVRWRLITVFKQVKI